MLVIQPLAYCQAAEKPARLRNESMVCDVDLQGELADDSADLGKEGVLCVFEETVRKNHRFLKALQSHKSSADRLRQEVEAYYEEEALSALARCAWILRKGETCEQLVDALVRFNLEMSNSADETRSEVLGLAYLYEPDEVRRAVLRLCPQQRTAALLELWLGWRNVTYDERASELKAASAEECFRNLQSGVAPIQDEGRDRRATSSTLSAREEALGRLLLELPERELRPERPE